MTPKLGFEGFSDWECVRLGDVAKRVTRKNKDNETDIPLTISSLDGLVDQRTYFGKTVAGKDMSGYYLLKKGEFAYNKSYSVGFDFGSIKRLDDYEMGALSTLYICFALNNGVNSDFFVKYFDSQKWYKSVQAICAEGARNHGLLNVPTDGFFDMVLCIPKVEAEQQKIADFLTAYDEKVSLQQQKVEALEKRKKGLLQKVFSQELRFKADDGSEFQEWEEKCFADFSVQTGKRNKDKIRYDIYAITNKYGFISQAEAHDEFAYMKDADISAYNIVSPYSFGYNPARINVGSIGYYEGENNVLVSSLYEIFQTNEQIIARFLLYWFKTSIFQKWVEKLQEGSVRLYFYYDKLCECRIAIPCLEEQQKIADFFSAIDEQIGLEKQRLEAMQTVKKGLLQQMFCDGSEAEEEEHTGAAAIYQLHPQASTLQAAQPDVEYNRSGQ